MSEMHFFVVSTTEASMESSTGDRTRRQAAERAEREGRTDTHDRRELAVFKEAFARVFPRSDTSFDISSAGVYRCVTYLDFRGWREFLDGLRVFRGNLAERRVAVSQFVFALEPPSREILDREDGIWFDVSYIGTAVPHSQDLYSILHELPSRSQGSWLVVPFAEHTDDDKDLYEECQPGEGAASFGRAVNISARFALPKAGLRMRTAPGTRLADYVRSAFSALLSNHGSALGGQNIIATTLFQMNDHLELVNHFNEKRRQQEDLKLFSLSAMQMEPVDDRDDTNIAVLVRQGDIRVRGVVLGE